ncbi:restriction endonuclease [Halorubrum ezzemoulense]|uniref:restriction endonuclease n=1 Tax=Halorubrum ezzemoulense TaxID=337243 RepID=UPI0015C6076D|nr:restriction endonuclease [Halorubrum ezzemoulense]
MSDNSLDFTDDIDTVGTPGDAEPDHDPTNGRWFETEVADTLEEWGYTTARNEQIFGLETDVIARCDEFRGDPTDFLVVECKDWHTTPVQRDAVEAVALRAALMRAMPVLAVARRVTESAWRLAQLLDVRIMTEQDLDKGQHPPLTERRPPSGTLNARREPLIHNVRDRLPLLVHCRSGLDIEAPVFHIADHGPCYVPERKGNDEYVNAHSTDYNLG